MQRVEKRVDAERRIKYKGTAIVRLECLDFGWTEPSRTEPSPPDRENVERLKGVFRKDCDRIPSKNHVVAKIDATDLDIALRDSGVSVDALQASSEPYPELKFPPGYQLRCLHGQDRIQAGREVLPWRSAWWTVDLYLSGK